jgi:hypothetical protein
MRKPIFALLLAAAAACGDSTSANYPSLLVRTSTTGASLDPDGYVLAIVRAGASPGYFPQHLARTGLFSAPRLPGTDSLSLSDVSPNCSVAGAPVRAVTLRDGDVADSVRFDVTCAPTSGVLTVRTQFSPAFAGGNVKVVVDSGESRSVAPTDSARFTDLADGVHSLTLTAPHFSRAIGPLSVTITRSVAPPMTFDSTAVSVDECLHPDPFFGCD